MKTISFAAPIILVAFLALLGVISVGCASMDSTSDDSDTWDYTKGVSDICPVHKIKMTKEIMPIGSEDPLIYANYEKYRVAATKFPFPQRYILMGCFGGPDPPTIMFQCSECDKSKKLWLKQKKKARLINRKKSVSIKQTVSVNSIRRNKKWNYLQLSEVVWV